MTPATELPEGDFRITMVDSQPYAEPVFGLLLVLCACFYVMRNRTQYSFLLACAAILSSSRSYALQVVDLASELDEQNRSLTLHATGWLPSIGYLLFICYFISVGLRSRRVARVESPLGGPD